VELFTWLPGVCVESFQKTPGPEANHEVELPELSGPYLGQTPPGSTPVVSATGYVSRENNSTHSGTVFSPNGTEVYWAAKPTGGNLFQIYFTKLVDGQWTAPAITSFTERHEGNRPAFTPDGQRLCYETTRNPAGGPTLFVERKADGWSESTALPRTINATGGATPYSVATDRSLHFGRGLLRDDEILVARTSGGEFSQPVPVSGDISDS